MDELRWRYYSELGYSEEVAANRQAVGGFRSKYEYWKLFELHALERLLADFHDCVFHLGAGHSVYEEEQLLERAASALAPFEHVVLLLPTPSVGENLRILGSRRLMALTSEWDFNAHFITHQSNYELATHIVYTEGRSPAETVGDIVHLLAS